MKVTSDGVWVSNSSSFQQSHTLKTESNPTLETVKITREIEFSCLDFLKF